MVIVARVGCYTPTTTAYFILFMVKGTYINSKKSFFFGFLLPARTVTSSNIVERPRFGSSSDLLGRFTQRHDVVRCSANDTSGLRVRLCISTVYTNRITIIIVSNRKLIKTYENHIVKTIHVNAINCRLFDTKKEVKVIQMWCAER